MSNYFDRGVRGVKMFSKIGKGFVLIKQQNGMYVLYNSYSETIWFEEACAQNALIALVRIINNAYGFNPDKVQQLDEAFILNYKQGMQHVQQGIFIRSENLEDHRIININTKDEFQLLEPETSWVVRFYGKRAHVKNLEPDNPRYLGEGSIVWEEGELLWEH